MAKINYSKLYTLRSDGRYQGYYRDADGKRHVVCDKNPERLYEKIAAKMCPEEITFSVIAKGWESSEREKYEDGTWAAYEAPYKRALERFGDRLAANIATAEIYQHMAALAAGGYSARTVKLQRSIYSLIYKWAANDERYTKVITSNPAAMATLPKAMKKAVKREAPPDEIVDIMRRGFRSSSFGLIPAIFINTGFRRGEALALQWKDVDFDKKIISCSESVVYRRGYVIKKSPKTAAGVRSVPLLPELEELLLPLRGAPEEYVLHGEDPSAPLCEATYKRRWTAYCRDVGLVETAVERYTTPSRGITRTRTVCKPTITAHVLRHGYATMLFEAGVDVYTAQQLLGHSDVQTTTEVYTHLRDRQKQKSIDKLISFLSPDGEKNSE